MHNRLKTILEIEHITKAQLADALGIQRGGITHMLSGRNKPSFASLEKIILKYPDISAEWLITGKGKPIRENSQRSTTPFSNNTFDNNSQKPNVQVNTVEYSLFDAPDPVSSADKDVRTEPSEIPGKTAERSGLSTVSPRKPIRVIVYFSDGTYTEFYPFSVSSCPE